MCLLRGLWLLNYLTTSELIWPRGSWLSLGLVVTDGLTLLVAAAGISRMTQDVHILNSWWRHQMETFSALLALCAGNSPVKFSLICACVNGWANNREAGDLRRHCAHYDVTVMSAACCNNNAIQYDYVFPKIKIMMVIYFEWVYTVRIKSYAHGSLCYVMLCFLVVCQANFTHIL